MSLKPQGYVLKEKEEIVISINVALKCENI